jgi:hypothetical protein
MAMKLKLDDVEIKNKYLSRVFWTHDQELWFKGIALEESGKKIHDQLSRFKNGEIVEVEAETSSYDIFEGICEIVEIDLPTPENVAPMLFRFSGKLKPIY